MRRVIDVLLQVLVDDLRVTNLPPPRIEASDWQSWEPSESVMLHFPDGTAWGCWVALDESRAEQLASLADQVQEWVVEELGGIGEPTNWPQCPAHPDNHPMQPAVIADQAVWRCPAGADVTRPIGGLSTD